MSKCANELKPHYLVIPWRLGMRITAMREHKNRDSSQIRGSICPGGSVLEPSAFAHKPCGETNTHNENTETDR